MKITAVDSETVRIRPGLQAPPLVCVTHTSNQSYEISQIKKRFSSLDLETYRAKLLDRHQARDFVKGLLASDDLIVGHNVAFDFSVFAAAWPEMIPNIFEAYDDDRISDTMIREKLGHIARGYKGFEKKDGKWLKIKYNLADVAMRRLKVQLTKGDWQLRFGELIDVPTELWPKAAKDYALTDVETALLVWEHQQIDHQGYLLDEFRQSRAAWWIQLMSCWGLHTDPAGVREFSRRTQRKYDDIAADLVQAGLLRANGVRDTKAAATRMLKARGDKTEYTEPSKKHPQGQVKLDSDCCERSGDPILVKYSELSSLKKTLSTDIPLLMQGIHTPIQANFDSLLETGRTSSSPNVQNLPREVGVRECFVPRKGWVFASADYSGFELRTMSQVCISNGWRSKLAEALNEGNDPHLEIARRILGISYKEAEARIEEDVVDKARQSGKVCFHPDTEVLTRVGWVKISELDPEMEVCSAVLSDDGGVDLEWEKPLALTTREFSGELVHLKNEGIDLRVTPDHRMCGWRRINYRNGTQRDRVVTCPPEDLGKIRYWPNAGLAPGHLRVDERLLRLAVAVQADGNYQGGGVRLGFTKKRKIERLRGLLKEDEYRFAVVGEGEVSTFWLEKDLSASVKALLTENKTLPWWWIDLVSELREVVLEEARFWDSHSWAGGTGYGYSTIYEENADVLQALATLTSRKSRCVRYPRPPYVDAYSLSIKDKHRSRGGNLQTEHIPYDGQVYCLTTRNDTIVVRDGGIPVITRQCNFGFPGGLGYARFVDFARLNYGVILDPDPEKALKKSKELKDYWLQSWPEFKEYFNWVSKQCEQPFSQIKQLYSDRFRGDVSFTEASNGFFQALAADAAKHAGFLISRACYVDESSVLYGCRLVNFVHDEFIVEVPDDQYAADAAEELARLMIVGANPFLPDVPPIAKPQLMRRWSKKAKQLRDDNGRLIPWEWKAT